MRPFFFPCAAVLMMLVCWSAAASDNVLRKCVAGDGSVSYQNAACTGETAWTRPFESAPEDQRASPVRQADSRPAQAHGQMPPRGNAAPSEREKRAAACNAAKARRKQTLDQVGLQRTYELLSRLDREVYAACKGVDR
jgi:hypothetical protein